MRIADPPIPPERIREFTQRGYWVPTTSADELEARAAEMPDRLALVDRSQRLTYGDYHRRVRKLAAHLVALGLGAEDVVAIQLPNWNEFAIALGAAVLAGIPFCQFHADFRRRELEFMLRFTGAAAIILPDRFRRFDYLEMIAQLQPQLPALKHVLVVGDDVPKDRFDLKAFLAAPSEPERERALLQDRAPDPNALMRTAFTSGTTGDPKAVLHLHNTTNCAIRFLNRGQRIGRESRFLAFLPAGLNWGLFNVLQALFAGARLILQDVFNAQEALEIIAREKVTHFCCAPAHLVAMLNVPDFARYDLGSLESMMTGGASCPLEIIREVGQRMPGHLLEMYGMLECGTQAHTRLDEDPEAVCGLVGRPVPEMGIRVVRDDGAECAPDEAGEILTYGPGVTIGYYNNDDANARSFTADGWFHTGDFGVLDQDGYLRIVGRKKEMIIRGGANIYPREIEEILYQHPLVLDAAIVGVPDARLGERVCACLVPKPGRTLVKEDILAFLKDKIATYKLPEYVELVAELPRTPTGKVQKTPLREAMLERLGQRSP